MQVCCKCGMWRPGLDDIADVYVACALLVDEHEKDNVQTTAVRKRTRDPSWKQV